MIKIILLCVLVSLSINAKMTTRTKVMMGTFVSISLKQENKKLFNDIFKVLKKVDYSLSSYKQNSPIFLLNMNKKANINRYTYEALSLSKKYYKKTDGYFNIAVGSITKDLYRFGAEQRLALPSELNVSDVLLSNLNFDKQEAHLDGSIKIDLGGMGKGFGVDKSIEYLKCKNVVEAVVALSGDIRCLSSCKIEVNNPLGERPLASFDTKKVETGISTSGNYNRYVLDTKHNHLINPKTKHSQNNFISITLISQELSSSDLDAYATAVSVMPKKRAYAFLDTLTLGYIVLSVNKTLIVSKNIDEYTTDLIINYAIK